MRTYWTHLKEKWKTLPSRWRRILKVALITMIIVGTFFDFSMDLKPVCYDEHFGGRPWRICVTETKDSKSPDILYYFHGYLESEKGWTRGVGLHNRKEIRAIWEKQGKDAPRVFTFSLGRGFFVTPEELPVRRDRNITVQKLTQEIMPYIEKKYSPGFSGRRLLMGVSMGGYNAMTLYLNAPQMWSRAVILNPLIPVCAPFAPLFSRLACAIRTFPNLTLSTMGSLTLVRDYFGSEDVWNRLNLITQVSERITPAHPPLMIQIGTRDDFGFYPGTKQVAEILQERNFAFHYIENHNFFHDRIDADRAAKFLTTSSVSSE